MNTQALKVALITAGARRIGQEIVKVLHQANYNIIIHCYRSFDEANQLAHYLNEIRPFSAHVIQKNLLDLNAANELVDESYRWKSRLDVLVNNASLFFPTSLENPQANWDDLFYLNVKIPYLLSLNAYPYLLQHHGVIINITDIHAHKPLKGYSVYCQTKAALSLQTKSLARELAPLVRVNAIAPGAIAWPEKENMISEKTKQDIIEKTPLKCHGKPLFVAQAVLSLIQNQFITGQILKVDGGRSVL